MYKRTRLWYKWLTMEREAPVLLSVDESAQLLGVNRKTIHALIAEGLPTLRYARRIIRIERAQLLAWGRRQRK